MEAHLMKSVAINLFWIISGSGLIVYPGILLASVMSFAAEKSSSQSKTSSSVNRFFFKAMMIVAMLFPAIYYFSFRISQDLLESGNHTGAFLVLIPSLAISGRIWWVFKPLKKDSSS